MKYLFDYKNTINSPSYSHVDVIYNLKVNIFWLKVKIYYYGVF